MVRNFNKLLSLVAIAASLFGEVAFAQENSLDQSADNDQGQYRPMDMGYAGFGSIGMMQSAWLDPLQNLGEGQTKPAYSKYYWSPDLVLPIRVREGMITMINFPGWEMVEDVFIGDNSTFDGQISGPNTVLLYPKKGSNVGVDTNVIIFGRSGNRYVFYVRSEGVNTERLTNAIIDIDVIGADDNAGSSSFGGLGGGAKVSNGGKGASAFNGGNSKSVASTYTKRFQKEDWIQSIPVDPEKFRFDVEVYIPNPDDVVIAPERVWRDDIFTYIDLGNKAINMNQRPIVTLINEKVETPVGFRTKGPNNRLIVVEAVGDLVMRNGKRIVCLKLRRSDAAGLEYGIYADDAKPGWDVPPPLKNGDLETAFDPISGTEGMGNPNSRAGSGNMNGDYLPLAGENMGQAPAQYDINVGGGQVIVPQYNQGGPGQGVNISYRTGRMNNGGMGANGAFGTNSFHQGAVTGSYDYSKMQRLPNQIEANQNNGNSKYLQQFSYGSGFNDAGNANISIELGTDANVSNLETLWDGLKRKYKNDLSGYEPFYSVDTPADGQGKELFHLRVGPIKSLEEGDAVCSKLGRNGVFCSVVRTQ